MTEKKIHTWIKFILLTLPFVFLLFQYCLCFSPNIEKFKYIQDETTNAYYMIQIDDVIYPLFIEFNTTSETTTGITISYEAINTLMQNLTIQPVKDLISFLEKNDIIILALEENNWGLTQTIPYYFGYAITIELLDCMTYIFTFFIRFIKKMFSKLEV